MLHSQVALAHLGGGGGGAKSSFAAPSSPGTTHRLSCKHTAFSELCGLGCLDCGALRNLNARVPPRRAYCCVQEPLQCRTAVARLPLLHCHCFQVLFCNVASKAKDCAHELQTDQSSMLHSVQQQKRMRTEWPHLLVVVHLHLLAHVRLAHLARRSELHMLHTHDHDPVASLGCSAAMLVCAAQSAQSWSAQLETMLTDVHCTEHSVATCSSNKLTAAYEDELSLHHRHKRLCLHGGVGTSSTLL